MLNKKNIAKAMAAATVLTTAAPMATAFADVVDNSQTEEVKALKAKVEKLINLKYTTKVNLLKSTNADKLAGKKVFDIKITGLNNGAAYSSYDAFEKDFDKLYASLEEGQKLEVVYDYAQPTGVDTKPNAYTELEDGTVVDFVPAKYTATSIKTGAVDKMNNGAEKSDIEAGTIVYTEAADGTRNYQIKLSTLEEDKETESPRYLDIKVGDFVLDNTKPVLRSAGGHYVDLAGDAIKPVLPTDITKITGATNGVSAHGDVDSREDERFVIDGFVLDTDGTGETVDLVKDVIVKDGHEVIEMTSTEMFNASEGRFTKEGNEILRRTTGLHYMDNVAGMDYRIVKKETVLNKELVVTVYGTNTEDANAKEHVVVELKITKDENDTRSAAYNAIRDFANQRFEDYIRTAAGNDRYETAAEASRMAFTTAEQVVLVSGAQEALVDGLTAAPLAASLNRDSATAEMSTAKGAPILLTKKDEIPEVVLNELKRLGTKEVFIVGGTNSVDKTVENTLKNRYGIKVTRLDGGKDGGRYETSLAVANQIVKIRKTSTAASTTDMLDEVFVVGGNGEADALSISAVAAKEQAPILLTNKTSLNPGVELFLKDNKLTNDGSTKKAGKQITVVGGTGSVSEDTYNSLLSLDDEIVRLGGTDRQDTNAKVLKAYNSGDKTIVMAKSDNKGMVDALGAGAVAGSNGLDVALVLATNELTEAQEDALTSMNLATDQDGAVTNKAEVGYGISSSIAKFIAKLGK